MGQSWTCVYTRNFWTVWLIFKNEVPLDSLDQDEFNAPYDVNFRLYRFSAISGCIKNLWKPTPPTIFVISSSKWPEMIFRPSLTKVIPWRFDFLNRLSGTTNQNQQKSNQTGTWVKSQQIFEISTLNLVYRWTTLQHVTMCKGNFISQKMIDIKQIEFIANAKIMLYTSAGQKLILWFNHKFIWRLLRMFSTQIWGKVDCNMKSRFYVNIWNMHAWLIANEIFNEMSPLLFSARVLHILTHSAFPLTHARAWRDAYTTFQAIVGWPSPHSFLGLKWRPLWILMVMHFRKSSQNPETLIV